MMIWKLMLPQKKKKFMKIIISQEEKSNISLNAVINYRRFFL